jgi:hypothetical protein
MRHEGVELATDAGLRYKGGGGGSFSSAAAGVLTAGAPTVSLPAAVATMFKRSAPEAESSHPAPPQKIFKREPEQQLLGFDFCGHGDGEEGEGEEVLGLTGSCSSEMEEGGRSSRQDFSLPSIMAAEIPGLDELMASESKS